MFGAVEGLLSREATVTVYRVTQSSGKGGSPEYAPSPAVTDLRMKVVKISEDARIRAFGEDSNATWRGTTTPDADVKANDLIVPDAGEYQGTVMEVEGKPRITSAGYPTITRPSTMIVALKETTKTV